jgi:ankyrin repeat protein
MQRRSVVFRGVAAAAAFPTQLPSAEKIDSQKFREAALAGDLRQVVSYLDRDPALIHSRDERGESIYSRVVLAGQTKVAEEFVRRGLKLDIMDASAAGDVKTVRELLEIAPGLSRARSVSGRTALHYAAAGGHQPVVIALQTAGADLNAGPEPPLIAAIDSPNLDAAADVAQTLLGNGAKPDAKRAGGKTAIEIARERGNQYVAELLVRKQTRDHYALRYTQNRAGERPDIPDVSMLPVELVNRYVGYSHGRMEEVKSLLKLCPALAYVRATFDEMGVEAGAHMGRPDMVDLLTQAGAPVSTCTATVLGMAAFVRKLIATDAHCVRERGAHDFPLLFFTAFGKEQLETAQILLDAGADVNQNVGGVTTLHLSAQKGYVELARLLLARGADRRMRARRGGTSPLEMAEKANRTAIIDLLR